MFTNFRESERRADTATKLARGWECQAKHFKAQNDRYLNHLTDLLNRPAKNVIVYKASELTEAQAQEIKKLQDEANSKDKKCADLKFQLDNRDAEVKK